MKLCTLACTANLGVPYILRIEYEFDLASLNRINCLLFQWKMAYFMLVNLKLTL